MSAANSVAHSARSVFHSVSTGKTGIVNEERNSDFLFTINKKIDNDFYFSGTVGGNQMRQQSRFNESVAGQLNIPGIYSMNNRALHW